MAVGAAAGFGTSGPRRGGGRARPGGASGPAMRGPRAQVLPWVVLIRTADGLRLGWSWTGGTSSPTPMSPGTPPNSRSRWPGIRPRARAAGRTLLRRRPGGDPRDDPPAWRPPSSATRTRRGQRRGARHGNPSLSGGITEGIISATGRAVTEPRQIPPRPRCPARSDPRADQYGQQRRRAGRHAAQVIGVHPGRGQPAERRPAQGVGFAIPLNLAPDSAPQSWSPGAARQLLPGRSGAQGRQRQRRGQLARRHRHGRRHRRAAQTAGRARPARDEGGRGGAGPGHLRLSQAWPPPAPAEVSGAAPAAARGDRPVTLASPSKQFLTAASHSLTKPLYGTLMGVLSSLCAARRKLLQSPRTGRIDPTGHQ